MRRLSSVLVLMFVGICVSTLTYAATGSFQAKILDIPINDPATPGAIRRLVAETNFESFDLNTAQFVTVSYSIDDASSGTSVPLYSDTVTIAPGQTQVAVGKNKTGRIIVTYSPVDQTLNAHLRYDNPPGYSYVVTVHVSGDVSLNAQSAIWAAVPL